MRAQRMSPKMPASVTPIASTTAMQPAGIASIAARVEIGDDQRCRRRQVFARRHEAQREGRPDAARGWPGRERPRAAHPDVAQALLQQHRGDGGGGDLFQFRLGGGVQGHGQLSLVRSCWISPRPRCRPGGPAHSVPPAGPGPPACRPWMPRPNAPQRPGGHAAAAGHPGRGRWRGPGRNPPR